MNMHRGYVIALVATTIFGSVFIGREVSSVCPAALEYSLGTIDERFYISEEEARLALLEAEGVWEEATEKELFRYNKDAVFKINFVFDERQEYAEAAQVFKELLDVSADRNETINETYEDLVARYEALEEVYKEKVSGFESRLAAYNEEVASYNEDGGAPAAAYQRLEKERKALDAESDAINARANELNQLAVEINSVSEKGNELIDKYNENVDSFNETFGESRYFTQGDYQGDHINIYKFIDHTELALVLAHEFGHALSLDHVENERSIMYAMMGEQSPYLTLTSEDLAEFERVCGEGSWITRLRMVFGL